MHYHKRFSSQQGSDRTKALPQVSIDSVSAAISVRSEATNRGEARPWANRPPATCLRDRVLRVEDALAGLLHDRGVSALEVKKLLPRAQ
jgi:hypothetical protein